MRTHTVQLFVSSADSSHFKQISNKGEMSMKLARLENVLIPAVYHILLHLNQYCGEPP